MHERDALRDALAGAIGEAHAARLVERIPPVTGDELARREDLAPLRADVAGLKTDVAGLKTDVGDLRVDVARLDERMGHRFDGLRNELLAEFRRQLLEQNRLLFFGTLGAVFTSAALAFAAVRF